MLTPLKHWFCDECGEIIESPKAGVLEKIKDEDGFLCAFKIRHHGVRCQHHDDSLRPKTTDLRLVTGPNGLVYLLFLLDPEPDASTREQSPQVRDLRECAEVFRRLLVPLLRGGAAVHASGMERRPD